MRAMRDLIRDRHGTYYAQRKVPERLQREVATVQNHPTERKRFLKKSLGTKVLSQANITAKPVLMEFDRILRAAEAMKDAKPATRASLSPAEINRMTTTEVIDATRAEALRDAAHASLQGSAKSKAANKFVAILCARLAAYESEHGTYQHKPGPAVEKAIGAFLADLLVAQSDERPSAWVHRSLHAKGFSGGPVGHKVFRRVLEAFKGLGLVEHAEGFAEFSNSVFGSSVTQRWASRFMATPTMLELAAKHRVPLQSADKHFTFQYELPKAPLQKREAKTSSPYTRKQVRGRPMTIAHTPISMQLEADVRELNEFLDRQQIVGGVHQGYIRIFQNGDAASFNWNYGGRLYSQPSASNYQQMSKKARLKMTINGEAVAEIDIRASYLTLFYGWFGRQLDFNSDPYLLPRFRKAGRDAVKLWMVATFGSARPINKWPTSLLKEYEDDHGKKLDRTRYAVKLVRERALLQHPLMARWGEPRNGRVRTWADLMYYESVVMVSTMVALMRDHGIPSLAVHDSLIVPQSAINTTATVLKARFRSVTQQEVQLTFSPKGLMVS
jgi:hypothetical protein